MRESSTSQRMRSPLWVTSSPSAADSSAARAAVSCLRRRSSSAACRICSSYRAAFLRSSSISILREKSPADRATEPPVKEPPALMTCPSRVTTR